jgi:hypothetical protein
MADCVSNDKHPLIGIVPDGDCILIVDEEKTRIRVNSQFLIGASAPFRAMLGPGWKEGADLRNRSDPAEIKLPEDNADAWKILCAVLHYQNDQIPKIIPIHTILSVAITADKYDIIRALKFASESWLSADYDETSDLLVLAAAAYLFQNAAAFRKITKKMVLNHNGSFTALSCAQVDAVMDGKMIGEHPTRSLVRSCIMHY